MIQKVCSQNIGNITKEVIDRMTDEVYFAVEDKEMLKNRNKEEKQNISEEKRKISKNQSLNDLIRILILRELLVKHKLDNFYRNRNLITEDACTNLCCASCGHQRKLWC